MWNCLALKAMHDGHLMQIHYVVSLLFTLFSVLLLCCLCFYVFMFIAGCLRA